MIGQHLLKRLRNIPHCMRKIFNNIFPCSKKKLKPILDLNKRHFKINQRIKSNQSTNQAMNQSTQTTQSMNVVGVYKGLTPPYIEGNRFFKPDMKGDFNWMINQPEYTNTLFIFNDDVESRYKYKRGGGNACIRPYNQYNPNITKPHSAGIPTGTLKDGGFQTLDKNTATYIDNAINNIIELVKIYNYDRIIYSIDKKGNFATGIFNVNEDVIYYITEKLTILKSI